MNEEGIYLTQEGPMRLTRLAEYLYRRMEDWRRGKKEGSTVVVVGNQGAGKTSYAFISAKQAYLLHKCNGSWRCFVERAAELCWGSQCKEPDVLDLELRPWLFFSIEDVYRIIELARVARQGGNGDVAPLIMIDDIGVSSLHYLNPALRNAYLALLDLDSWRRAVTTNLIVTTVYESKLARVLKETALVIYSRHYEHLRSLKGDMHDVYRYCATSRERLYRVDTTRDVAYVSSRVALWWCDIIPRQPQYGLPQWLESAIDARKVEMLSARARSYKQEARSGREHGV